MWPDSTLTEIDVDGAYLDDAVQVRQPLHVCRRQHARPVGAFTQQS